MKHVPYYDILRDTYTYNDMHIWKKKGRKKLLDDGIKIYEMAQ